MTETEWLAMATNMLKGRMIVSVRWMRKDEADGMGWYARPIVLTLDDGTELYPSKDEEGNDGGALFTNRAGAPTLPVL